MTNRLEKYGAYQKAIALFDLVVADMDPLKDEFTLSRLVSQQLASADSICSNIEEGFGRLSRKEYIRFLDFARGSARETQGRYKRLRHWLSEETVQHRTALLDEIIAILTSTMATLGGDRSSVREEPEDYAIEAAPDPRRI